MKNHECEIGVLWEDYETTNIVTLSYLKSFILREQKYQKWLDEEGYPADYFSRKTVPTLRDYGDLRKATALSRFKFCPECGRRIDWKAIRAMDTNNSFF